MIISLILNRFYFMKRICIVFVVFLLASCNLNKQESTILCYNEDLKTKISKYVTCSIDTMDMMLASTDSICEALDTCSLECLGFDVEHKTYITDSLHSSDIKTIVKLYGSYDITSNFSTHEADAAFAWHEIAKSLIEKHYGRNVTDEEYEKYLRVISAIVDSYGVRTQYDMNISAWRKVMLADFRLISAYKKLFDTCNKQSMLGSVHGSYLNVLTAYRNRCKKIEDSYSDLPRELACMQISMMNEKRSEIELFTSKYLQGKLTIKEIISKLDRNIDDTEEWNIYDY